MAARAAAAAVLCALALGALAGCGDEEESAEIDAVVAATEALVAEGTAVAKVEVEGGGGGEQLGYHGTQRIDFETEESEGEVVFEQFEGVPEGTRATMYSQGERIYAHYDFLPRNRWVELPPDPMSRFSTNPAGMVEAFDIGLENVDEEGEEEIDGEPMTVYRGGFDIASLIKSSPEDVQEQFEQDLALLDGREAEVALYVDDAGVLRRTDYDLSALLPEGTMTAKVTFTDLGAPVEFHPPPPDQVRSLDELAGEGGP